jgi:hypothetical protein
MTSQTHERPRLKTTGIEPLEPCRPVARGHVRGRISRLHALLRLPAISIGQLRNGGKKELGIDYGTLSATDHRVPLATSL